ncbi:MAG: hypothetical protein ACO1QB_16520 [Verrucomicrobiales bacterium]
MIKATSGLLHWNYFLALESDIETLSRYVEFAPANFEVFSIELAHILFTAASEVDVLCKLLCARVAPNARKRNIDDYRSALTKAFPSIGAEQVFIPRYALTFTPWDNWAGPSQLNPNWWKSYNNVKHERDAYFKEATLKNALNALAALLIVTFYFYRRTLPNNEGEAFSERETTRKLKPGSNLFTLNEKYYYQSLIV